ncbi:hypothetical protein TNCV_994271 [Trichonephila clavipes]|nr:hypothetical protein TNCV_994271 [Trichonephila clavipes]
MEGDSGRGELMVSAVIEKSSQIHASRREARLLLVVRSRRLLVGGANGGGEKKILSSSTLGFRMPEKSDKRTELFKLLRKSDQQVVTARALS